MMTDWKNLQQPSRRQDLKGRRILKTTKKQKERCEGRWEVERQRRVDLDTRAWTKKENITAGLATEVDMHIRCDKMPIKLTSVAVKPCSAGLPRLPFYITHIKRQSVSQSVSQETITNINISPSSKKKSVAPAPAIQNQAKIFSMQRNIN